MGGDIIFDNIVAGSIGDRVCQRITDYGLRITDYSDAVGVGGMPDDSLEIDPTLT